MLVARSGTEKDVTQVYIGGNNSFSVVFGNKTRLHFGTEIVLFDRK
jgi:hypothetical protein